MFVSILGDSISTYEGYNPEGYSVYYDEVNQYRYQLSSVYDTWWAKVNQALRAWICRNNSYSGSMVSGITFPAGNCLERTTLLHTEQSIPELILIYMGVNDFGNGVPIRPIRPVTGVLRGNAGNVGNAGIAGNVGNAGIAGNAGNADIAGETSSAAGIDLRYFEDAYYIMLERIKNSYPKSRIICGTLLMGYLKDDPDWRFPEAMSGVNIGEYNQVIREACKIAQCDLADLAASGVRYETLDGVHPTRQGHAQLAQAWMRELETIDSKA